MSEDTRGTLNSGRAGSTTSSTGSASGSGSLGGGGGILANAHEAPRRTSNPSGFRSALKAAFIPQQPGKQMKTGGKPLGKSFHRETPLPQMHEGGEVLKIDPRGPNAPVGDGVVLGVPEADENEPNSAGLEAHSSVSGSSVNGSSSNDLLSPGGYRNRSGTMSTDYSDISADSRGNPCSIKFAPLPTSGRLKRANSITIGVAARSQLLHSQGAGRNGHANGQMWQQQYYQQQLQQQQQQRQQQLQQRQQQQQPERQSRQERAHSDTSGNASRYSGIQPQETVDLGEELRRGALKAWDRVRRGSSASRGSEGAAADHSPAHDTRRHIERLAEEEGTGEETPKRSQSPTHEQTAIAAQDEGSVADANSSRKGMQRRISTGTFTGHASFREMEEKRKRGGRRSSAHTDARDDERENEATRFIEMLGSTGAGKEEYHGARVQQKRKDSSHVVDTIPVARSSTGGKNDVYNDGEEEEDDEETREAQRLADQALKGHSAKATKAAGMEKIEKQIASLSLGRM